MNGLRRSLACVAGVVLTAWPALAQAPNFAPGRYLCADGAPITGNNLYSSPAVTDWNADGRKDLLVGVFYEGNIWLFLNQGTDAEPVLTDIGYVQAGGEDLGVGYYSVPASGGTISFDVTVRNPNVQPVPIDFYTSVQNAPLGFWGPLILIEEITLEPGREVTKTISQRVPGGAPSGYYDYAVFLGDSPEWQFLRQETFWFMKW